MGSFSIWHWIIVLVILAIPVFIGLTIWLIVRASKRPPAVARSTVPPAIEGSPRSSAEARLQELASLRSKELITDAEYEQQRSAILREV
jgi:hypothetical protein